MFKNKIYKVLAHFYAMPINAGPLFQKAEYDYAKARTNAEKLTALQTMLKRSPKHKGAQNLLMDIKARIARVKEAMQKEKTRKKSSGASFYSVKKEGAAQVVLVGMTNAGRSTLLKKLTNANVEIAAYPFTTKKPEVGIMDYKGIKIQVVEVPAITPNFSATQLGPTFLSLIRQADLVILMFKTPEDKKILDRELADVETPVLIYNNQENVAHEIWKRLPFIKVYTKQPGKERDYPPIAFKKGATVREVAEKVHKDFVKKFRYAKIFGTSVKFMGAQVGLDHALADDDVVEFHLG